MSPTRHTNGFEALDACHRQIHVHLHALTELAQHIEAVGVDTEAQQQAAVIEQFFSSTSRQHHLDEEKNVFPPLLLTGNEDLVNAVRGLQQDHGWIEQDWIELAPLLRAIAQGNNWYQDAEFQHAVSVFVPLLSGHIALEETLIYPESKARWAQAVAARQARRHKHPSP